MFEKVFDSDKISKRERVELALAHAVEFSPAEVMLIAPFAGLDAAVGRVYEASKKLGDNTGEAS